MKPFAWLALAVLALALSAPSSADATLVPGGEVVAALSAVGLPSELAPPTIEAPFVLSSAFDLGSALIVEAPLSSRPNGSLILTTIANAGRVSYLDASCADHGERPGGFQILLEFRTRLRGN